jgi:hypothetical protein
LRYRELAKLLTESKQDIPECLEPFKPDLGPEFLFQDDDDDDEEDEGGERGVNDDTHANNSNGNGFTTVGTVAKGATWDSGDNSVVYQGEAMRINPPFSPLLHPSHDYHPSYKFDEFWGRFVNEEKHLLTAVGIKTPKYTHFYVHWIHELKKCSEFGDDVF